MKEVVIFDVDNTLVCGQSQGLLIKFLKKRGYVSNAYFIKLMIWLILYKMGFVKNPLPAMKYGISFIKGKTVLEVKNLIDDFFESILVKSIYPKALQIIKNHQDSNREVILVSNSPDILIAKIAEYLDIKYFLSTKLEIVNGIYTGNIVGEIMYGEEKVLSIKKMLLDIGLSFEDSWGYGDHESDKYVLSAVTKAFAVNPTKQLKFLAQKNNWEVLKFEL